MNEVFYKLVVKNAIIGVVHKPMYSNILLNVTGHVNLHIEYGIVEFKYTKM